MNQSELFGDTQIASSIDGLVYEAEFLTEAQERHLIELVRSMPLHAAKYRQWEARRRVTSFGGSYDFDANRLQPGVPLDARLHWLRDKVANWLGVPAETLVHALVAEYSPGTPLGWNRDVPDFETIAGVSLGGHAALRFRPFGKDAARTGAVQLEVAPRSVYKISGEARWAWQHSVSPTTELRWSITLRTRRRR